MGRWYGRRASTTIGSVRVLPLDTTRPAMPADLERSTLVLTHSNVTNPKVSDRRLEDDRLIEVSQDGKVLWDWRASDHADDFGFTDEARAAIRQAIGFSSARDSYDWLHINAASYVGPNHWVRRRRYALRTRQCRHQQPRVEHHRDRGPLRKDCLADGPGLPRVRMRFASWARSSVNTIRTSFRKD